MSLNYKKRKNEKGFAIALALLMLVAMSLMGATLMVIAAGDHKRNGNQNVKQQTFYAAETGISEAKKWLASQSSLLPGSAPGNNLSFCKTTFFPELSSPKLIKDKIEKKNLNELISGEDAKLSNYSYEYFITYTPDQTGNTQTAKTSTVSGTTGGDISQGTTYKDSGTSIATFYNNYSCGCNANKSSCNSDNVITVLQSTITLTQ